MFAWFIICAILTAATAVSYDSKRRYNVVRNRACRASTRVAVEGHAHGTACVKVMGGWKKLAAYAPRLPYESITLDHD